MAFEAKRAFEALPSSLADDLLNSFRNVVKNYAECRWEPSELNGGKLCEAAYTILEGFLSGTYESRACKPPNIVDACKRLETQRGPRSARVQIPRMIVALYEIRNNRGVGHVGGDIDPNHMDATAVLYMSKWIVAELVRLIHGLPILEASEIVESLVEKEISLVWHGGDMRRVLVPGLTLRKETLLLLSSVGNATESELLNWLEQKRASNYRSQVLRPMHRDRLIHYDQEKGDVVLLPPGVREAEKLMFEIGSSLMKSTLIHPNLK